MFLRVVLIVIVAVVCFVGWGIIGEERVKPITGPLVIEVTGEDYAWSIRYPGADGMLGNGDDFIESGDVTLAAGIATKIVLKSNDYLYGFELPDFGLSEIAVPDMTFSLLFTPDSPGTFRVRGHQMCNYTHSRLNRTLTVYSASEFARWSHNRPLTSST